MSEHKPVTLDELFADSVKEEKEEPQIEEQEASEETEDIETIEAHEVVPTQNGNHHPAIPQEPFVFAEVLQKSAELFKEQSLLNKKPEDIDFRSLALTKAKASSLLDAINNVVNVSHLTEIVKGDKLKFKRENEMEALNPLLSSFKLAAVACQKNITLLIKKFDMALESMQNPVDPNEVYTHPTTGDEIRLEILQTEMIMGIQQAFTAALNNMNMITKGITNVIQLERFSGSRPWGNSRSDSLIINDPELIKKPALPYNQNGQQTPRKLTSHETLKLMVQAEAEDRDLEDGNFTSDD